MSLARYGGWAMMVSIVLWLTMVACLEIGRRVGLARIRRLGTEGRVGVGVADGLVYGMLAFLVGFSFTGAAARFDHRRELVATEVSAVGTAWARLDLLPAEDQAALRPLFRGYLDALLTSYVTLEDTTDAFGEPPAIRNAQQAIWTQTVAVTLAPRGEGVRVLVLPSLNEMFDAVEKERLARRIHPPSITFATLALIANLGALFAGVGIASGTRNWLYMLGIATVTAFAIWVILELEYPRLGIVRIDGMDQALMELRATFR